MTWTIGAPLPYDGWYNGNPDLMIENGTYADFRPKLALRVEYGRMEAKDLEKYDELWEAVPLEEKKRRRSAVVEDATPKPVEIITSKGKVTVFKAKPSENNNAALQTKNKDGTKRKPNPKRTKGLLTHEDSPLETVTKTSTTSLD
jgi:hypothetical protein